MTTLKTEYEFAKALIEEELKDLLEATPELAATAALIAGRISTAAITGNAAIVAESQDQLLLLQQQGILRARAGKAALLENFIDRGLWVLTRTLTALAIL